MHNEVIDRSKINDAQASAVVQRRLIFLSHANPEDNVFVEWLAAQLVIAGYEVWCDVTQLLGGERFWNDITEAIDGYAAKFLFVSTLHGNTKSGSLRELRLAHETEKKYAIKDFIIPLKIDHFPFGSMQKGLSDLNIIRFDETWAAGLAQLLKLLERESIPKSETANASSVTNWYRRSLQETQKIVVSNDKYVSNWFRFKLPQYIYFHQYRGSSDQLAATVTNFSHAHKVHNNYLITFAPPHEIEMRLGPNWDSAQLIQVEANVFIDGGSEDLSILSWDATNIVSDLVRQAWEKEMHQQKLHSYELASGLLAWFFKNNQLEKNRAYFEAPGGRRAYRQLVGAKSKKTLEGTRLPDGYWHYAISASPQLLPFPRMVFRHHVIFTENGEIPWANAERMHKARRSVCKQWWNQQWRDRLLAFCAEIGKGFDLKLAVGEEENIILSLTAISFLSPWTYFEDGEGGLDETSNIELVEEQDDEEVSDEEIN